jgi:hypothetical protein
MSLSDIRNNAYELHTATYIEWKVHTELKITDY